MSPAEFYYFAAEVYANPSQVCAEAGYRTVVSRAYYAAFLAARDTGRLTHTGADTHQQVIKYWAARKIRLSNRLEDLKDLRAIADYNLQKAVTRREAGQALKRAKQVLDELRVLQ